MWQGTLILLYLRLKKKRNHTRNFLIALKWMVLDLFMSTVENFSISREETNSKWYGFQHKKCGQESIMDICNLMMEKLVKWRKSRSERCDFRKKKKIVKWKKSRSLRCDLTKKMWSGNGNMQPPGMWSAPGHNPMMESQWASHYQEMPQNQVSTY